jgi:hypothetical protein
MIPLVLFLIIGFSTNESTPSLKNTKWELVGYITPANDTIRHRAEINYRVEFLPSKKLLIQTSLAEQSRSHEGKYKVKQNQLTIRVFISKATFEHVDETLPFDEFNLRLKFNKTLNGETQVSLNGEYLTLKRPGIHSILFCKAKM